MFKKLGFLSLMLLFLLLITHINSVSAISISNYFSIKESNSPYQIPGKNVDDDVILAFIMPHIRNAFKNQNINTGNLTLNSSFITSTKILPNNQFQIEVYVRTLSNSPSNTPLTFYIVTVVTDGKSVNITDIALRKS